MRTRCGWIVRILILALTGALSTMVLAQTLLRLPPDLVFPQGEASLGEVTFRHLTHVDQEKPDCTRCHPALFKILEREIPAAGGAAFHSEMESGRQCGVCHDGKAAFGIDDCLACHHQE